MGKFFRSILDKLNGIVFFLRTGIRRSTVSKICRDLSNRYLTPGEPGRLTCPVGHVEIVTSTPQMRIDIDGSYWFDRQRLAIKLSWEEWVPLWDHRARKVLQLFKYFRDTGIAIPMSSEGVQYVTMPGEEEFNAGNC